jgi:hypothetical protein
LAIARPRIAGALRALLLSGRLMLGSAIARLKNGLLHPVAGKIQDRSELEPVPLKIYGLSAEVL